MSSRLRCLMVSYQAPPVYGGAGQQAVSLAAQLVDADVDTVLLTGNQGRVGRTERLAAGPLVRRMPGEGWVARLPQRWARAARTAVFVVWQSGHLMRHRYDVFHVHGVFWWSLPTAVAARLRRRPLVVKITRQGEDDAGTVLRKTVGGVPVGRLYSWPMRHAHAVIALNEVSAQEAREALRGTRVEAIPNGVDTERYAPDPVRRREIRQRWALPEDAIVVLFAGYLAPVKGVRTLVEAWSMSSSRSSDALVLAGPDGGVYRELDDGLLDWLAAREAQDPTIRRLGHVTPEELQDLYRAADVFVLPSLAEGMPNSLLEALASGLPAVASSIPGSADVLSGLETSRLVPPGDAGALRQGIDEVLAEGPSAGGRSRAWATSRFSLEAVAGRYRRLYDELLCEQRTDVGVPG